MQMFERQADNPCLKAEHAGEEEAEEGEEQ